MKITLDRAKARLWNGGSKAKHVVPLDEFVDRAIHQAIDMHNTIIPNGVRHIASSANGDRVAIVHENRLRNILSNGS